MSTELQERLRLVEELVLDAVRMQKDFLKIPQADRKTVYSGTKPGQLAGKASLTAYDLLISLNSLQEIIRRFPDDSFYGEEFQFLKHGPFSMFEDPIDGTSHAIEYDSAGTTTSFCITYLLGYKHLNEPVIFGFGVALEGLHYSGSTEQDIFLNGKRYEVPATGLDLLLGINEQDYASDLEKWVGSPSVDMAGRAAKLIIGGYANGGINLFPSPEESTCLMAMVSSIPDTTITDLLGNPGLPEQHRAAVWSRKPVDHEYVLEMARKKLNW